MPPHLPFVKMHGCANDYVVVDASRHAVPAPGALARAVCARRTGVGADGLLLVSASGEADFAMQMFNVDGTEAEMCGNGLRCAARFALEEGLVSGGRPLRAATASGVLGVELLEGGSRVAIDMGRVEVSPEETLEIAGQRVRFAPVNAGNPHAVVFVEDVQRAPVAELGAAIETHPRFPERTNVEFVQVLGAQAVRQRTWERGCGETPACGTGACAVAAAGVATGRTGRSVAVHLDGGTLDLTVGADGAVRMVGPAMRVFDGRWTLAEGDARG